MEDSFHIFTCWGSDCFKFHHVLAFTLTESLMGPGKNGCILQLIICRTCPSCARLWDDLSASLSVPLSAVSVVFTAPVPAQKVPSVVLTKIGCICLVWRRAGMKREKRWKDSEKTRGGKRVGDERVIWAKGRWRRYVYVEDSVAANYLASLIKCKLLTELRGCWCWR